MWPLRSVLLLCCALCPCVFGYDELFPGPSNFSENAQWAKAIEAWRSLTLKAVNFNSSVYDKFLLWTQSSFVQVQVMVHERTLFDRGEWNVEGYLEKLKQKYGGVSSILLWPTYPNLGIDDRNQFEMIRSMPQLKEAVETFHRNGVHVLLPYNPWDVGTFPTNATDMESLVALALEFGTDGFNGDTMGEVNASYWQAALSADYPLAIEPELGGDAESLFYTKMSWGYMWNSSGQYDFVPGVARNKFLESRHMIHVCDRWNQDKASTYIPLAWFNGMGVQTWENVWSFYNGMTPRDCEAVRRVSSMLTFFEPFYSFGNWTPHSPDVLGENVFASRFELRGNVLYNVISKTAGDSSALIKLGLEATACFDCYRGLKLDIANLTIPLEGQNLGYGCVICLNGEMSGLSSFLQQMGNMTRTPLQSLSSQFVVLQQKMRDNGRTYANNTEGMVIIPPTQSFQFIVQGIEIEGGDQPGIDVQFPWEDTASRFHNQTISLEGFVIDKFPVTNADWLQFLNDSGYKPRDTYNYLRHWINQTLPRESDLNKPVVWVSIFEMDSYCAFYGKRLPYDFEWQYAATGGDISKNYPWGNVFNASLVPTPQTGRVMGSPDDVDAHPEGCSSFGVCDLIANVWQVTSLFEDEHTRAAVVRGGSFYNPQGSMWYFPHGTSSLVEHSKLLLMWDSLDRSGAMGFRCVADNKQ